MIQDRDYWERRKRAISSLRDLNEILVVHEASMSQIGWMKVPVQLWMRMRNPSYVNLYEHEALRQSKIWFCLSTLVAMTGFALITMGTFYAFYGQPWTGVLVTISSVIPNTVATMFYANHRYANARADEIYKLHVAERKQLQELVIVETISDSEMRDNAKLHLIKNGDVSETIEHSRSHMNESEATSEDPGGES